MGPSLRTLLLGAVLAIAAAAEPVNMPPKAPRTTPHKPFSVDEMRRAQMALMAGRPSDCPPCFNCLLPAHSCAQYAGCNSSNGICECPAGFGGDDCLEPLCASLPKGKNRPMRQGATCECDEGWDGINCNVCTTNAACDALVTPPGLEPGGAVCYPGGEVIKENYQMCDVTNEKIKMLLGEQKPQVTFTCKKGEKEDALATCDFQFWVDHRESFYCHLQECSSKAEFTEARNSTAYSCDKIECSCIPDRMLCGENGSVDITDFLAEEIHGPGRFECLQLAGGVNRCKFREPAMDDLIMDLLGDESIQLECRSGECLWHTDVPGYERPVKRINTPLIASVIAGCSLFLVAAILATWYLSRHSLGHGPIALGDDNTDSDDEQMKLMADHKPAALFFENVTYTLNGKRILSDITGAALPGEVTAIMGASGAGKTTFLDILARKNKRGVVSGGFYVNGELVSDADFKNAVGFVDQEDTMLPTLTVHETILNSALLRLPRNMSRQAKEQRVVEVEKELGIYHIRNSLIGSEEGKGRGISGGEKRRVGIACELVTSPSILFLDEPTSGLDAYNAYNVVESLVTLAKAYKRTVVFTIHQPRSNIVALFDRLVLLAQGNAVYSGAFTRCQAYFSEIGYSCPTGFNIADYLVDLTMHAATRSFVDGGDDGDDDCGGSVAAPSSVIAIKSIASVADDGSTDVDGAVEGSSRASLRTESVRTRSVRNEPVRRSQDRDLFTRRRRTTTPPSHAAQPDTAASSDAGEEAISTYRLQRNPATNGLLHPSSSHPLLGAHDVHDAHDLPPTAPSSTELDELVQAFAASSISQDTRDEIHQAVEAAALANGQNAGGNAFAPQGNMGHGYARVGYLSQFLILSSRTWKNLYRNPMLMLTHYAIAISLAVLSGWLFYGLTDDIRGFQNRLGLFFFLLALFGFSSLTSLHVFAAERLLFVRERANGYYAPATYFAAKFLLDIVPLRIVPPVLMGSIIYPMTGLVADLPHFARFMTVLVLFNLAAAAICFFVGVVCRDGGVANLVGSLIMLFSLLFAGLLLNHETIPAAATFLQTASIFHYGFEALIVNEVVQLTLIDKKYGLDITVPGAAILSSFGFDNKALTQDVANLAVFAVVFILLAYTAMHFLLVEKR